MKIELTNEEVSFIAGVIAIWMRGAKKRTERENRIAVSVVNKITA